MSQSIETLSIEDLEVPAVVLRVPLQVKGLVSPAELYERSRGNWVMRPALHPHVMHAIPVSRGIIREIYRVYKWIEVDVRSEPPNPHRLGGRAERSSINSYRWRFDGSPDMQIRERYIGKSIYLPGSNPVTWADKGARVFSPLDFPTIQPLSR